VYDSNLPRSLASSLPGINAIIQKQHITVSNSSIHEFTSVGGNSFTHFAKTAQWSTHSPSPPPSPFTQPSLASHPPLYVGCADNDLYEGLIAPGISDNLFIETYARSSTLCSCAFYGCYIAHALCVVDSWMRPKMDSFCPPQYQYAVMDVTKVTLWPGIDFEESKDHSKW
jgi:hypothetical protein